jgi:hypothetical protein
MLDRTANWLVRFGVLRVLRYSEAVLAGLD